MDIRNLIIVNIILLILIVIIKFSIDGILVDSLITVFSIIGLLINGFIIYILSNKKGAFENKNIFNFSNTSIGFLNNDEFKQYVYDNFCQCANQCIGTPENFINKQDNNCSQIILNKIYKNYNELDKLINRTIKHFNNNQLLLKSGVKYYILDDNSKIKFNWENIKSLKNKNTQELFWLFRKLIVDGILKKILSKYNISENSLQIYSVGSTKITSDYDITLYGDNDNKVLVIQQFQKIFKNYFVEDSSIIFDTNIYGKAYIAFNKENFGIYGLKHSCNKPFYYLSETPNSNSQLLWGLIKYFKDIKEGLGEEIFINIYEHMNSVIKNTKIIENSYKSLITLINKDTEKVNYVTLMKNENKFLNYYSDKLLGIHDLISAINFYGMETYFTRGAFLDTVVNAQMCGNKNIILNLPEIDYITSILENSGFFFIHSNKSKYIIRVFNTFNNLINNFNYYNSNQEFSKTFNEFSNVIKQLDPNNTKDYDSNYCKNWISNNIINLNKCHKFKLYDIILNLITQTLNLFILQKNNNTNIPFYDIFITKNTEIFGDIDIASPKLINIIPYNKIVPI